MNKILDPIHPGLILKEEFLDAMGITAYKLAKDISVPLNRITEIISKQRRISIETGLLLSKYFGMSDGFWIQLQIRYDEQIAKTKLADKLEHIVPISHQGSVQISV